MDTPTIEAYEERGGRWVAKSRPVRRRAALAFGRTVAAGQPRVDLGCGAGRYLGQLGRPAVGLDASPAMLARCREAVPGTALVCGDLEALPFGPGTLAGGWANMSYLHVPRPRLPLALADLHAVLRPGAAFDLQVLGGDYEGRALPDDDVGGRYFAGWRPRALADVATGAGFTVSAVRRVQEVVRLRAIRARTLADTVGPDMLLLVVGLNPSLRSADAGIAFAPRGNRFWTAASAAGVVSRERDPRHALLVDGVGMTDVVKRASARADALSDEDYRTGMTRLEWLVAWLTPALVCFVGLSGWRAAVDRGAGPGLQERRLGGRPVYVMPSSSGANAHAPLATLVTHLEAARATALAERSTRRPAAGRSARPDQS
jgi:double-stranded uracil-DNA glycosylase